MSIEGVELIAGWHISPLSLILVGSTDPGCVAVCACDTSLVADVGPKRAISLDREDLFATVFPLSLAR